MKKKIAILQSNYIPWKGYFDMIASVDEFVFYDTVQYTKNDWRNRNQVKSPQGLHWLTIPVLLKGNLGIPINKVRIKEEYWRTKHLKTLQNYYAKAPYFSEIMDILNPLYEREYEFLCQVNYDFIYAICDYLNIKTKISFSSDFSLAQGQTEALISLCKQANAEIYISGSAAKNYLDIELMQKANIELKWFDYSAYPLYNQLHGEFIHTVSIVDLLFNCGKNSKKYMKYA